MSVSVRCWCAASKAPSTASTRAATGTPAVLAFPATPTTSAAIFASDPL